MIETITPLLQPALGENGVLLRPVRVLFVCLGNICRSPAAEGLMLAEIGQRNMGDMVEVDSCGTGGWHVGELPDRRMRVHARERGLELTHRCRRIEGEDFRYFDIILGMDSGNLTDLRELAPDVESTRKIVPMCRFFNPGTHFDHVPDPYYAGYFDVVLDLLTDATRNLLDTISMIVNGK